MVQMNELNTAQELVERCLYALECAWHPSFVPTTAACRLPYAEHENRPLFIALFKHVQSLGRRGCHRSALESCKVHHCARHRPLHETRPSAHDAVFKRPVLVCARS
jgi:hypothetical protein